MCSQSLQLITFARRLKSQFTPASAQTRTDTHAGLITLGNHHQPASLRPLNVEYGLQTTMVATTKAHRLSPEACEKTWRFPPELDGERA